MFKHLNERRFLKTEVFCSSNLAFGGHLFQLKFVSFQDQAAQIVQVMSEAFEISPRFNSILYPGLLCCAST